MFTPLKGVRVLDFSQYATENVGGHFADLGAEVIKIEPPPVGSLSRIGPGFMPQMARGKKSLAIDLKVAEAKTVFEDLLKQSHVLIDGLRAGALDGLGLSYEDTMKINPALVYISISGWGQTGPYRRLATHGQGFDAFAALEPVVWENGLPKSVNLAGIGEVAAKMGCFYATVGGLAALVQARETGRGSHIDVSEGEAGAWYHWPDFHRLLNGQPSAREEQPESSTPRTRYHVYPTKDGQAVYLMTIEEKFWANFCRAVGREDMATRGKWNGGLDFGGYEGEYEELVDIFKGKTKEEWLDLYIKFDIAGAPANSLSEIVNDPHFISRDPIVEIDDPRQGKMKILGTPIKVKGETFKPGNPPRLGEQTDDVLRSIGYDQAAIAALREKKAVQ